MKNQLGMTIIELLFALSIAAILLSLAVPSFVGSIRNSDMASSANTLVGAIHAARAEAVKTRGRVTICRGIRTGNTPKCDEDGFDILVFSNTGNDGSYDAATDTLLRATPWLTETMTTKADGIPNYISFTSGGITQAINGDAISGTILMCGVSLEKHARLLTLSPTGRPTVQHYRDVTNPPSCPTS